MVVIDVAKIDGEIQGGQWNRLILAIFDHDRHVVFVWIDFEIEAFPVRHCSVVSHDIEQIILVE